MNPTDKSIILPEMSGFVDFISLHMLGTMLTSLLLYLIIGAVGAIIMTSTKKIKLGITIGILSFASITAFGIFSTMFIPDKPYEIGEIIFGENTELDEEQYKLSRDIANAVYENSVTTFEYTDTTTNQKMDFHVDGRVLTVTKSDFTAESSLINEVLSQP